MEIIKYFIVSQLNTDVRAQAVFCLRLVLLHLDDFSDFKAPNIERK